MDETDIYDDLEDALVTECDSSVKDSAIPSGFSENIKNLLNKTSCMNDSIDPGGSNLNDGDLDLYSELLHADNKERREKEEQDKNHYNNIIKENIYLKDAKDALDKEVEELRSENVILKQNISSLYKTAKAEVDYKNELIVELRTELDGYIFRRRTHDNHRLRKRSRDDSWRHVEDERNDNKFFPSKSDCAAKQDIEKRYLKDLGKLTKNLSHDVCVTDQKEDDAIVDTENGINLKRKHKHILTESITKISSGDIPNVQVLFNEFEEKQAVALAELNKAFIDFNAKQWQQVGLLKNGVMNFYADEKETLRHSLEHALDKRESSDFFDQLPIKKLKLSAKEYSQIHSVLRHYVHTQDFKSQKDQNKQNERLIEKECSTHKSPQTFSASLKKDVLKLYHYQNAAVPYAIKRKLGLPPFKSNSSNTESPMKPNVSSKLASESNKKNNFSSKHIDESDTKLNLSKFVSDTKLNSSKFGFECNSDFSSKPVDQSDKTNSSYKRVFQSVEKLSSTVECNTSSSKCTSISDVKSNFSEFIPVCNKSNLLPKISTESDRRLSTSSSKPLSERSSSTYGKNSISSYELVAKGNSRSGSTSTLESAKKLSPSFKFRSSLPDVTETSYSSRECDSSSTLSSKPASDFSKKSDSSSKKSKSIKRLSSSSKSNLDFNKRSNSSTKLKTQVDSKPSSLLTSESIENLSSLSKSVIHSDSRTNCLSEHASKCDVNLNSSLEFVPESSKCVSTSYEKFNSSGANLSHKEAKSYIEVKTVERTNSSFNVASLSGESSDLLVKPVVTDKSKYSYNNSPSSFVNSVKNIPHLKSEPSSEPVTIPPLELVFDSETLSVPYVNNVFEKPNNQTSLVMPTVSVSNSAVKDIEQVQKDPLPTMQNLIAVPVKQSPVKLPEKQSLAKLPEEQSSVELSEKPILVELPEKQSVMKSPKNNYDDILDFALKMLDSSTYETVHSENKAVKKTKNCDSSSSNVYSNNRHSKQKRKKVKMHKVPQS